MEKSSSSFVYDCCLPDDVTQEIIARLPVKSLVRFKSVCKTWKAIIANPTFTKTQLHHSTRQHVSSSHIIFREDNTVFTLHLDLDNVNHNPNEEFKGEIVPISLPKFTPISKERSLNVFGSCDGMLCVHVQDTNNIYLWNPSTNESRRIPWPISSSKACKGCCKELFGFGFVSSINDYKIVLVATYRPNHSHRRVHVYSLRENKWREIDPIATAKSMKLPSLDKFFTHEHKCVETVLLNDALYWTITYDDDGYSSFILKFDMVNEIFQRVAELKEIYAGRYWLQWLHHYHMGAYGDDLNLYFCHLFMNYKKPDDVEMWVLDDQHYSWKKKFILKGRWNNLGNDHTLLRTTANGKVLIFERGIHHWCPDRHTRMENLLIFDWRRRKHSYIQVKNEYSLPYKSGAPVYNVVNYDRTLISPNNILK